MHDERRRGGGTSDEACPGTGGAQHECGVGPRYVKNGSYMFEYHRTGEVRWERYPHSGHNVPFMVLGLEWG